MYIAYTGIWYTYVLEICSIVNIRYRAPYHANRIAMSHEASASLSQVASASLSLFCLPLSVVAPTAERQRQADEHGFPPQTVQKTGKLFHLL